MIKILKYSSITLLFFFTGCLFYSPINEEVNAEFSFVANKQLVNQPIYLLYIPKNTKDIELTWVLEEVPTYSELSELTSYNDINERSFTPDLPGDYTVSLKVVDQYGAEDIHTKTFTIKNNPPIAVITSLNSNNHFVSNKELNFSGENSYDEDFNQLEFYEWSILKSPDNSRTTIDFIDRVNLSITPDLPGDYTIKLEVTDTNKLANYTSFSFYVNKDLPPKILSTNPSSSISLIPLKQIEAKEFSAIITDDSTQVTDLSFNWDISLNNEEFIHLSNNPKLNLNANIYGIGDLINLKLTVVDSSENKTVINWRVIIIE